MASMALHCSGSVPLNWLRAKSLRARQRGGGHECITCRTWAVESKLAELTLRLTHTAHTYDDGLQCVSDKDLFT